MRVLIFVLVFTLSGCAMTIKPTAYDDGCFTFVQVVEICHDFGEYKDGAEENGENE